MVASSWLFVCLGRVGLGRLGWGVSRGCHGWLVLRVCPVGLAGCVWCRRHACCCLMGGGGCPCVCGGGMLSGFWGSAPWLPDPSGAPACWGLWVGVGGLVVNCIVDASILLFSVTRCFLFCSCVLLFVVLSVRWMPWHQGPMKDVVACDIPRGAGWRAVIRGFPNGGTRHELCRVTCI